VHSLNLLYPALLLRNVVRSLLQNIDHVKMLYVNLHNLFHCCYLFFFVLISALLFVQFFLLYYDYQGLLFLAILAAVNPHF